MMSFRSSGFQVKGSLSMWKIKLKDATLLQTSDFIKESLLLRYFSLFTIQKNN